MRVLGGQDFYYLTYYRYFVVLILLRLIMIGLWMDWRSSEVKINYDCQQYTRSGRHRIPQRKGLINLSWKQYINMHLRPRSKTEATFNTKTTLLTVISPKASLTQFKPDTKPQLTAENTHTNTHANIHKTQAPTPSNQARPNTSSNRKKYIRVVSSSGNSSKSPNHSKANVDILHSLRKYLQDNIKESPATNQRSSNPIDTPIKKLSILDDSYQQNVENPSYQTLRHNITKNKQRIFSILQWQQQTCHLQHEQKQQANRQKIHIYSNVTPMARNSPK